MPATSVSKDEFLGNLRQSGLAGDADIATIARAADTNRGRVVARVLVRKGVLTRFQAELLLAGRTTGFFLGQYKILDQLGKGGMGRVYKAVHTRLNRVVALKMLSPRLVNTPRARALFRGEVQAAGRLNHPNIVTAYDANRIDGRHFLVLEYVDGPNLDQFVREHGPLPVGLACEIIRQAAAGLQHAADVGMVHRDIKPANLLIERAGKTATPLIKILDFGLARLHETRAADDSSTLINKENVVMGTPDYLSPEQARDLDGVDIRSDLYSLGCTFYFLLTGRVPYPGGTPLQKLLRHSTEEPAPIEQDLPAAVLAILRRLLAKLPEARFQTPAELAAALAPYAAPTVPFWSTADDTTHGSDPNLPTLDDSDGDLALIGTLPPDLSPTPLSGDRTSTNGNGLSTRLWMALALSTGIVGALVGLLSLLLPSR